MARFETANNIINSVATEVGLLPNTDPVGSTEDVFVQFTGLLTSAGREMVELNKWQILVKEYTRTIQQGDTGTYDLPDDFSSMIDQTGWDRTRNVPLGGPLSAQQWTYLKGRDLASGTIYVTFRQFDGKFNIYPDGPDVSVGVEISFEYQSRDWAAVNGSDPLETRDSIVTGSDIVLFEPILMIKFLKAKWQEAKGFDSSAARIEFENIFNGRVGRDTGAAILNASGGSRGLPYITPYGNTTDSWPGLVGS
jgi:hypothetical protein